MRYSRIQQICQDLAEFVIDHRLRDVVREPSLCSFVHLFSHCVRGKSHDGMGRGPSLIFPSTDIAAGFVAIFDGHFDVALGRSAFETWVHSRLKIAYNDERVVAWLLRKYHVRAFQSIISSLVI